MTLAKRMLDVTLALVLLALLWPVMIGLVLLLLVVEGRPIFFLHDRMSTPTRSFKLVKFRTMRCHGEAGGVTGGDKAGRISRLQRLLRRSRADELPQLWNVLRGDISLVGPRPPMPYYVEAFPALYAEVLKSRPGITGLATLRFHAHEEAILATCTSPEITDHVYRRRCVHRKARLDLIYQRRRTVWMDLRLIAETALNVVRPRRRRRKWSRQNRRDRAL
ncbi:sugar transferase [Limimaricola pyoseonensis]|nr:sugar transferase [Limimaricola pyoseonensis]